VLVRFQYQQRVFSLPDLPPQVRILDPSKTEKWSANQIGSEGAGHDLPLALTTVTLASQCPTHPPTRTVEVRPSPLGDCTPHSALPHCSVSVGVPKHSPRSPSHVRVLCRTPPRQLLEQELNEPHELHFLRLPLLQILDGLHPSNSVLSPKQPVSLRGIPLNSTVLAVLGDEHVLVLDLLPVPQVAEQELQLLHLLQESTSLHV